MRTAQNYTATACGASLTDSPALDVVKSLFTQFHQTQWGTPVQWFATFKQQVYALLGESGYSNDEAELLLRSKSFCVFAQATIHGQQQR